MASLQGQQRERQRRLEMDGVGVITNTEAYHSQNLHSAPSIKNMVLLCKEFLKSLRIQLSSTNKDPYAESKGTCNFYWRADE